MVFGEGSLIDGDDLLEQRDSLFDLAVGFIGYYKRVLRREQAGVVFGEGLLADGDNLFEQHDGLFDLAVSFIS